MTRLASAFLVVLLWGLAIISPANAQESTPVDEYWSQLEEHFPGISTVYMRVYTPIDAATPAPTSDNYGPEDFITLAVTAYTFDTNDRAEAYFDEATFMPNSDRDAITDQQVGSIKIRTFPGTGSELVFNSSLILDGTDIFMVSGTNIDLETVASVAELIARTPSNDKPVDLREDGTSTGGVFDRMPAQGDVPGWNPGADSQPFPLEEAAIWPRIV